MSDLQQSSSKVTLEDLLRIKRAERPAPEFWPKFEQTLREKQLSALVRRQPWWKSRIQLSRLSLPLSAAAALAITLVVAGHQPRKAPVVAVQENVPATTEPEAPELTLNSVDLTNTPQPVLVSTGISNSDTLVPVTQESPIPSSSGTSLPSGRLASVTEQVAGIGVDVAESDAEQAPQFAAITTREPRMTEGLDVYFQHAIARLDIGTGDEKVSSVEPLSQIPTPRDARRARLLAFTSSVDTHSPHYSDNSHVIRSRERIASHLNEEALYDSIRRLGVQGDRVSIQF